MKKKMKFLFAGLVLVLGLVGFTFMASGVDVPEVVKSAFNKKYPTAQKVEWEAEDDGIFEAEFKMDGKEMSANFSNVGDWLETEVEIKHADLPDAVKQSIIRDFKDYKIKEVESVEKPNEDAMFEIELTNKKLKSTYEAVYSKSGQLIEKEISADNKEEKDEQ